MIRFLITLSYSSNLNCSMRFIEECLVVNESKENFDWN